MSEWPNIIINRTNTYAILSLLHMCDTFHICIAGNFTHGHKVSQKKRTEKRRERTEKEGEREREGIKLVCIKHCAKWNEVSHYGHLLITRRFDGKHCKYMMTDDIRVFCYVYVYACLATVLRTLISNCQLKICPATISNTNTYMYSPFISKHQSLLMRAQ